MDQVYESHRSIGPTARTLGPIVVVMAITLLAIVGYFELVSILVDGESGLFVDR